MRNKLLAALTTTALTGYASGDTGTEITTPMGRIVWGHPLTPRQSTDNQGNKKFNDQGQPIMEVSFGLAIPTEQFQTMVWPTMAQEIGKGYPNGAPGNFSYKMTQAHEIDNKGKPYSEREGYAGCVVLACSTTLQPPVGYVFENGAYRQISADQIKTGDYVTVGLNMKVNVPANRSHTPSIYVNPLTVLLCYEGDAIAGAYTVDPTKMFGAAPQMAPAPQGARPVGAAAPMQQAPQGAGMPGMGQPQGGMPGMGQPQGGMPGMGAPMQQQAPVQQPMQQAPMGGGMPGQAPMQQQMPPPATDFIPGAPQPQQQGMPGMGAPQGMNQMPGNGAPQGQPGMAGSMPGMPQR